jgi:hypothetical protein
MIIHAALDNSLNIEEFTPMCPNVSLGVNRRSVECGQALRRLANVVVESGISELVNLGFREMFGGKQLFSIYREEGVPAGLDNPTKLFQPRGLHLFRQMGENRY